MGHDKGTRAANQTLAKKGLLLSPKKIKFWKEPLNLAHTFIRRQILTRGSDNVINKIVQKQICAKKEDSPWVIFEIFLRTLKRIYNLSAR